ncbi:hypothetical protein D9V37_10335 [Nocardioides mangrovicus]|uniref:DUF2567 domain-containing protein n=1 Tax=Nocardioides mangrovicus TaxID=2478913 RepID=A0A3L8P3E0_9ACTN|nr:hypothetical protein D9V37_10335 [Nocardioides mangrovicus]
MLRDLAWVVGTLLVLGVVAGLVWWRVADPPYYVRTSQGAVMDQAQLARRVHADGTFMVLGAVAGLLAGLGLTRTRREEPLLTLLLGVVAAVGAGFVALWLGRTLGHVDVRSAVRAAKVGAHVTDTLGVITPAVVLMWPIGYLIAAVGLLWGTSDKTPTDPAASVTLSP